ncbi:hypothetical protein DM02DRAFT_435026 [Periconia macrospinosa]|uniref:Mediator of RNA polymerase II transcription subunit 6 n=1 Tax=Periconia macrospinosa TaxID=97972 RepID=A0A2V1DNG8_9PLEO|nr:hypothetical protein DM02DRAFT_435026 [Periconia macrospinosa]
MPPAIPPLDEQVFERPDILSGLPGGNINADSILWYFMNSPFYDPASNNSALFNQLRNDPNGMAIMQDRRALEERLRTGFPTGISYVVASEPSTPEEPWVIQRQFIAVKGGPVQVQGTYYTAGMKILMAPSLLDILRSRMLSVSTHMAEVFETSKELSHFAPATNHSYLPATYDTTGKAATASRIGSRIGSPTLAATDPDAAPSQSQSQPPSQQPSGTAFSDALFMSSMHLTSSYYHEFMDENPLTGEPGAFVYNKTYDAVLAEQAQARQKQEQKQQKHQQQIADAVAAANSATGKMEPRSTTNSAAATPRTGPVGTPVPAGVAEVHSRKGSASGASKPAKEKRRKSKGLGSPVTPTAGQAGL